jgi:porin
MAQHTRFLTVPGAPENGSQQEGAAAPAAAQPTSETRATSTYLTGTLKIGAWLHTGRFADQRFDALNGLLAAQSGAPPMEHAANSALYGVVDQTLWRDDDRSLGFFARGVATASDRNPIDLYADAGLTLKGPIDGRPRDSAGIAFAFARISPVAVASDYDQLALSGTPMPIRSFEATIELTYQTSITDNWRLQPDLKYIIHPGGRYF